MASFVETQPIQLPHFSPSVDASIVAPILMQKGEQYKQNSERIQGQIDYVANLPVVRDVDKQYLQEKLSGVTSQLNGMVGADWSSNRLLQQAGGLAGQIANDKNVQNAVISAQGIKSLQDSQREKKDKHPELYTNSMEDLDNQEMNRYISNNRLGDTYRGPKEASNYYDYRGELQKQLKEISPDVQVEIGADGQFTWKSQKLTSITNDKIKEVVNSYMGTNPDAQKSMYADALYTYKGADPSILANNVNHYYTQSAETLKSFNAKYADDLKNASGNPDLVADIQMKIRSNENTIKEMESKASQYTEQLKDPSNIDQVKFGLFSDNFSNGMALTYQKQSIERDIKENIEAVQTKDFGIKQAHLNIAYLNADLDPTTGLFPTPDSPYYATIMAHQSTKTASSGGASSSPLLNNPINDAEAVKNQLLDTKILNTQINNLQTKIGQQIQPDGSISILKDSPLDRLRAAKYNDFSTQGADFNGEFAKLSPQDKAKKFNEFLANQSQKFINGEDTDPKYKEFRQYTYADQLRLSTLIDLDKQAKEQAVIDHPMAGSTTITVNPYTVGNNTYGKILVPYNSPLASTISSFITQYNKLKTNQSFADTEYGGAQDYGANSPEVKALLDSYRNSPDYNALVHIVNSKNGIKDMGTNVVGGMSKILEARQVSSDAFLSEKSKNFNQLLYQFSGKPELQNEAKVQIYNALVASKGVTTDGNYNIGGHTADDIIPLGKKRDLDGNIIARFQIKGNNPAEVKVPQMRDDLPNNDPYDYIKQAVDVNGHTPSEGAGALSTYDGRIRYQISKGLLPDTYQVGVIDKGVIHSLEMHEDPLDNNSPLRRFVNPGQIKEAMDKLQSEANKRYKIPGGLSNSDLNYYLTHHLTAFEDYLKSKYQTN